MSFEWLFILALGGLVALSLLKRVIWLAIVAGAIAVLIHFGVLELAWNFVKDTLLQNPPIVISVS